MSAPSQHPPLLSQEEEAAERAARIRAMLARWEKAGEGDDPEWDVDELPALSLARQRDDGE